MDKILIYVVIKSKTRKYMGKIIALSFLSQFFQTVVRGPRDIQLYMYIKDRWRRSAGGFWN